MGMNEHPLITLNLKHEISVVTAFIWKVIAEHWHQCGKDTTVTSERKMVHLFVLIFHSATLFIFNHSLSDLASLTLIGSFLVKSTFTQEKNNENLKICEFEGLATKQTKVLENRKKTSSWLFEKFAFSLGDIALIERIKINFCFWFLVTRTTLPRRKSCWLSLRWT